MVLGTKTPPQEPQAGLGSRMGGIVTPPPSLPGDLGCVYHCGTSSHCLGDNSPALFRAEVTTEAWQEL